jgi:alanine racemase
VVFLGSDYFDEIIQYDLSPVVFDLDTLAGLSVAAERQKRLVGVHLKIDVGMGRLGIMPHQMEQFLRAIKTLPGLYLAGVMGHFSAADNIAGQGATKNQLQQFSDLVRNENICLQGMQAGEDGPLWHIANSAAIMHYPDTFFQLVRPGIALYGYHPGGGGQKCPFPLKPVMSFKTRVLQVKEVPAGYGVSYGHLFVTKRRTTLAVLPVGYADGYSRGLTGRAEVLIRGKRAAIRGRICMNACLADVTDIPGVSRGDEVVLLGSHSRNHFSGQDRSIFADEIAGWLDTISYEVLCLFGSSNDRVYLNEAS